VRLDSIGDVLMTTPAIRALRECCPERRITLLTSTAGAAVARLIPEIDEVVVHEAPWMKASGRHDGQVELDLVRLLAGRFDAAVIFTVFSQSPLPAALLCHLAGIPLRLAHCHENPYQLLTDWVPDPEPAGGPRHEVQRQLELVASVGCTAVDDRLSLSVPGEARARVRGILGELADRDYLVIHPGSTAASRRYPPERFAAVAARLAAASHPVVVTGDASERQTTAAVATAGGEAGLDLGGRLDLATLAAAIEGARLLITNNTGPAHIAAAVGTPVVDLYALTNPQHTPWRVPCRVLSYDVPCRWCYKSVCPEGHHRCLLGVSAEEVVDATLALLEETAGEHAAARMPGAALR
jgi:lipopolysaccharide heptosyltransferase II